MAGVAGHIEDALAVVLDQHATADSAVAAGRGGCHTHGVVSWKKVLVNCACSGRAFLAWVQRKLYARSRRARVTMGAADVRGQGLAAGQIDLPVVRGQATCLP